MAIYVGDIETPDASFTLNGVATDPSVLTFQFIKPDGTTTTYTYGVDAQLVRDSVGNYHVQLAVDLAGNWSYEWVATGTVVATLPGAFVAENPSSGVVILC